MKIIVVIPAYNEEKVISSVVNNVKSSYNNIIVIDDGSDDSTADIAEKYGVTVLRHLINRGQGAALKTGIIAALNDGADIIVTFDADGQHSVSDINNLVKPIMDSTADVTLGSRFLNNSAINITFFRKFILKLAVLFTRVVSRVNITDTHNGLRAFSRKAAEMIEFRQDRMAHASEIFDEIRRNKLSYCEVPVTVYYDTYSTSKGQSSLAFGKIIFKYFLGRLMR